MISLSAPIADTTGHVMLKEDQSKTRTGEPVARMSKTKCLDGTVNLQHSGVVDGDRTFTIVVPRITEAEYTIIKRLYRNYTSIVVASRGGVFAGAIKSTRVSDGTATIIIEITSKLSE